MDRKSCFLLLLLLCFGKGCLSSRQGRGAKPSQVITSALFWVVGFREELVFWKRPVSSPLQSKSVQTPCSCPELCILPEPVPNTICWWQTALAQRGLYSSFVMCETCTCWKALERGDAEPRKSIPRHTGYITHDTRTFWYSFLVL